MFTTIKVKPQDIISDLKTIELISDAEFLNPFFQPEQTYDIQGFNELLLQGVGETDEIEINFNADNPEAAALMKENLKIQYCLVYGEKTGEWSEWILLNQLPLKVNVRDFYNLVLEREISQTFLILIRFNVPQHMQVRHGIYQGKFSVKIK